jgi:hypothetical protein
MIVPIEGIQDLKHSACTAEIRIAFPPSLEAGAAVILEAYLLASLSGFCVRAGATLKLSGTVDCTAAGLLAYYVALEARASRLVTRTSRMVARIEGTAFMRFGKILPMSLILFSSLAGFTFADHRFFGQGSEWQTFAKVHFAMVDLK